MAANWQGILLPKAIEKVNEVRGIYLSCSNKWKQILPAVVQYYRHSRKALDENASVFRHSESRIHHVCVPNRPVL